MKSFRLSLLVLLWLPAVGWAEVNFYLTRAGTGIDGVTWYGCDGTSALIDLDLWIDTGGEALGAFSCDLVASVSGVFEVTDRVWKGTFADELSLPNNPATSGQLDPVFQDLGGLLREDLPGTSFPMLVETISISSDGMYGYFELTLTDFEAGNTEGGIVNILEVGSSPVFDFCGGIPEPASLMLAAAGGLALLRRRGRSIG